MKRNLLTSILGVTLLGASALALADNGRGHDRSPSSHGRHGGDRYSHGRPHWDKHWHAHVPRHQHWHGPAWHAPYHRQYGYAPRYYERYDDGLTIIFKGRID